MSLNPFASIKDFGTRRIVAGVARDLAKGLAALLVARGWMADDQSANLIELLVGAAVFGYTMYMSYRDKQHTEKVIEAASSLPASAERATIEKVAKEA